MKNLTTSCFLCLFAIICLFASPLTFAQKNENDLTIQLSPHSTSQKAQATSSVQESTKNESRKEENTEKIASEKPQKKAPLSSLAQKKSLLIGLILPGSNKDNARNQALHEDLLRLQNYYAYLNDKEQKAMPKVNLSVQQNVSSQKFRSNLQQLIKKKADIVVAHGEQYVKSLLALAPKYPNTTFVTTAQVDKATLAKHPNVISSYVDMNEAAYVLGVLAGLYTKKDFVALLDPINTTQNKAFAKSFASGLAASNKDAKLLYSEEKKGGAAKVAPHFLKAGADVLIGLSSDSQKAIPVAAKSKALWIGAMGKNPHSQGDKTVLAAQLADFGQALDRIIISKDRQGLSERIVPIDLESGWLYFQFNRPIKSSHMKQIDKAKKAIIDGTIGI